MSLTTKVILKTLLGISDSSLDDVIDLLILQADSMIKGYLHREIEEKVYTEYYSGTGDHVLQLNQTPVQSITSVHEDRNGYYGEGEDAFPTSSALVAGTDFVLRKDDATNTEVCKSGILYRIGKVWHRPYSRLSGQLASSPGLGMGNIKVVYTAGWATVPTDIQFAANKLVTSMLQSRGMAGCLTSESIEDYSYTLSGAEDESRMLDSIKGSLARYKKVVI
ncbi:phage head-tail connector protein [Gimesia maris]|uniref:phage head-tail connector protein n=1 Tax=Gimesia maris TaxID=122 RepID=UPI00241E40FC|nr:phage head-tail connector protein [Gimesia maris]|tara:strand:+ start:151410 stop:152072 length:663 start_codon:yes stop_codon:yes gene_type:complete